MGDFPDQGVGDFGRVEVFELLQREPAGGEIRGLKQTEPIGHLLFVDIVPLQQHEGRRRNAKIRFDGADEQFLQDAEKLQLQITAAPGSLVESVVSRMYKTPKHIVDRAAEVVKP